jgi:hypothetical protein
MRISDRVPVAPRCLGTMVASVAAVPLSGPLLAAFVSEEDMARAREWHAHLGRAPADHVATHDELCAWSLACTCGATAGKWLGVRTDDVYSSPVCFACAACGKLVDVFDEAVDGWNGETDRKRRRKARRASTFALRCGECKGTQWQPAVLVTYQGDAEDFAGVPIERWQDFFDVIAIGGTCIRCGAVAVPASFECA